MSELRLNIRFTEEELRVIHKAHQKVVLVKHTAGATDTAVPWASFKPWQYNTVEWENRFAIYTSNNEAQSGAAINKLSDKIATAGIQYNFNEGIFDAPAAVNGGKINTYTAKNDSMDSEAITLGLAQNVVVNDITFDHNPVNVPVGLIESMAPFERIDVYLTDDNCDSTSITHIQGIALPVEYGEDEKEHSIVYNGKTGDFLIET